MGCDRMAGFCMLAAPLLAAWPASGSTPGADNGMTPTEARAYLADQGIDPIAENVPQQILIGNAGALDALVAAGVNVNAKTSLPQSPLELAAMSCAGGRVATPVTLHMVDTLLASGADSNAPGMQGLGPLMIAAQQCRAGVVDRLLQAGAKLDSRTPQGFTPLGMALIVRNYDAAAALIGKGARITPAEGQKLTEGANDPTMKALVARAVGPS